MESNPAGSEDSCLDTALKDNNWTKACEQYEKRTKLSESEVIDRYQKPKNIERVSDAGIMNGLSVLLNTQNCGFIPRSSFLGLKVLVHENKEFPEVLNKGFVVSPGTENFVSVHASATVG